MLITWRMGDSQSLCYTSSVFSGDADSWLRLDTLVILNTIVVDMITLAQITLL